MNEELNIVVFDRNEKRVADLDWSSVSVPVEIEDVEGESKFQFDYPITEEDHVHLLKGNFVAIPSYEITDQFNVYEITKSKQDDQKVYVDADHIYVTDLNGGELVSFNTNDDTADIAIIAALEKERWEVGIVEVKSRRKRSVKDMQPLEALRYIQKEWGGELRFRVTMSGSGFDKFYVDLLEQRGSFNGVRFEFGHNLSNFSHELQMDGIVTAMYGRGKAQGTTTTTDTTDTPTDGTDVTQTETETEVDDKPLTFANIEWSVANGDPVDKPLGQDWVGDEEARLIFGRPDGKGGKKHIFGVWESQAETELGLLQETWLKVRENRDPLLNIEADVISLSELSPDFEYERTLLGDEVFVIVENNGQDIAVRARILKVERDRKNGENTKYEIGNYIPVSMSQRFEEVKRETDITKARRAIYDRAGVITPDNRVPTSILDGVIDAVQNAVISSVGHVYQDENGILILNAAKEDNPTKAMRLSGGVLAIANSKTANGDWNWRTFGDGDGFVADEIITGTLRTDLIEILGDSYFRWNGNNLYILDPDDSQKQIRIGNYEGDSYGIAFTKDGGLTWNVALDHDGFHLNFSDIQGLQSELDKIDSDIQAGKEALEALKLGIRNMVYNSTFNQDFQYWSGSIGEGFWTILAPEADKPSSTIATIERLDALDIAISSLYSNRFACKTGEDLMFSMDFKVKDFAAWDVKKPFVVEFHNAADERVEFHDVTLEDLGLTTLENDTWYRIVYHHKITTEGVVTGNIRPALFQNGTLYVREVMVHKGVHEAEYVPAIEDFENQIIDLGTRVNNVELAVTPDGIISTVTSSTTFQQILDEKADMDDIGNLVSQEQLDDLEGELKQDTDNKIQQIDFSPYVTQTQLTQTTNDLTTKISAGGGVNLIKNSVGYAGFDFFETVSGSLQTRQSPELNDIGFGSGFYSDIGKGGYIEQTVPVMPNRQYTISHVMRKTADATTQGWAGVDIRDGSSDELIIFVGLGSNAGLTEDWQRFSYTFIPQNDSVKVRITMGSNTVATITGVMLNEGSIPMGWTLATGELYNTNVRTDINGIRVARLDENGETIGYTQMTPTKFGGTYINAEGEAEEIFYLSEDETVSKKFRAKDEFTLGTIKQVKVNNTLHRNLIGHSNIEKYASGYEEWNTTTANAAKTTSVTLSGGGNLLMKNVESVTGLAAGTHFGITTPSVNFGNLVVDQDYTLSFLAAVHPNADPSLNYTYIVYTSNGNQKLSMLPVSNYELYDTMTAPYNLNIYRVVIHFKANFSDTFRVLFGSSTSGDFTGTSRIGLFYIQEPKVEAGKVATAYNESLGDTGDSPMRGWALVPTTEIID
ncbi:minor tail protein [Bacillus phage 035JT001]|nr:minor tail protein [Bacillus phage 035JT001]